MPLPINTTSLVTEMRATLNQIDMQIKTIQDDCNDKIERGRLFAESTYQVQLPDGRFILTDLLVAKANLLAAIGNLQAKPGPGSGMPRRGGQGRL